MNDRVPSRQLAPEQVRPRSLLHLHPRASALLAFLLGCPASGAGTAPSHASSPDGAAVQAPDGATDRDGAAAGPVFPDGGAVSQPGDAGPTSQQGADAQAVDASSSPTPEPLPVAFQVAGTTVRGRHYVPSQPSAARGAVVMAHGLGGIAAMALPSFAQRFAEAGLHVVLFDYRNFGESDTDAQSPRQLVSTAMQLTDWRSAIAFTRQLDGVDPGKLALWGSSLSGGHVLVLGAEDPGLAAVLAQVPHANATASALAVPLFTSLELVRLAGEDAALPAGAPPITVRFAAAPGELALMNQPGALEGYMRQLPPGAPWKNETPARFVNDFTSYSPDATAAQSKVPTLIIVAKGDNVTPPGAARDLANAMGAKLIEVEQGHFDVYHPPIFDVAVSAQLSFLAERGLTR